MGEEPFLLEILKNPRDRAARAIYADWLEEQGDAAALEKAEYLRGTVELAMPAGGGRGWRRKLERRLKKLAESLESTWLRLVSRLKVENCKDKRERALELPQVRFDFLCDQKWDELQSTEDPAIRFCGACHEQVFYCDTIGQARRLARDGKCVALDPHVERRRGDLGMPRSVGMRLGRVMPTRDWRRDENTAE